MNPNYSRGALLFEQGRHDLAEKEFRQALSAEPDDAQAHAMLALCLAEQKRFDLATEEARQAVHLAPDEPFAHYALARVFYDRNRHEEALAAITEAVRLDPADADYYSLQAAIHFDDKRWVEALAAAERGLQFNAEHIGCNNLRAMTLVKLGRRAEAGATIEATLSRNPESGVTHANQGWACLERGERERALEHFREALRLDPQSEWARAGIVEALKAGNFLYALMLRYFFFMSKLSPRVQWGVIIGGYFGNRLLASLAKGNPHLTPWVLPVQILYLAFVFLTWTADPIFNLVLRLNRYGRLALTDEQRVASNWVGTSVGLALISILLALAFEFRAVFLFGAFVFGFLVIPLAASFKCQPGWPRQTMIAYTCLMATAGVFALSCAALSGTWAKKGADAAENMAVFGLSAFGLGAIGSSWVANILIMQRPKK
ncbi:MAG: tetratricopeptide repeat protein [Verrucomicrobiales bacterium]|nr:tetratricopeptide repeat protein [Verrucomicrobiales bacterium]